jgi:hypothetical protein
MQEDPQTTSTLLLDFSAAAGHPPDSAAAIAVPVPEVARRPGIA